MTDVIHHIPDLDQLFQTLYKKLKNYGKICILTESHEQIQTRWFNRYFKSLNKIEMNRYPDISQIIQSANLNELLLFETQTRNDGSRNTVDELFIKMVEEKNYSMFRLLDDMEYNEGLSKLKADKGKMIDSENHGETLLWFQKKSPTNTSN